MNRLRGLDPRWGWLYEALTKLYEELEDDALPSGLSLMAVNDNDIVSYGIVPGKEEVDKRIISSPSTLMAIAEATTIDANSDEV